MKNTAVVVNVYKSPSKLTSPIYLVPFFTNGKSVTMLGRMIKLLPPRNVVTLDIQGGIIISSVTTVDSECGPKCVCLRGAKNSLMQLLIASKHVLWLNPPSLILRTKVLLGAAVNLQCVVYFLSRVHHPFSLQW